MTRNCGRWVLGCVWVAVALMAVPHAHAAKDAAPAEKEADATADSSGANPMGDYNAISVEADVITGGLDGTVRKMEGNSKVTLLSDDPNTKPLPFSADTITFTYPEDGSAMPSRIVLDGKVVIEHALGTFRAGKGDLDLESQIFTFTDHPVMDTPKIKGVTGDTIILNFTENTYRITKGDVKRIELNGQTDGGGSRTGTLLLRADDITDWKGFLTSFKEQGASSEPSPSKHILSLFEPNVASLVKKTSVEELVQAKAKFIEKMNEVLRRPDFYNEAAWGKAALSQEVEAGLKAKAEGKLEDKAIPGLNRLLFDAAYPAFIKPRS